MSIGQMSAGYRYQLGSRPEDVNGSIKGTALCAYKSRMDMLTWRTHIKSLTDLGFEVYPAPHKEVKCAAN